MRKRLPAIVLLCIGALVTLSSGAAGQGFFPSHTTPYRFLPQLSVLNESGGIAGRDVDYNVVGTFDFVTTLSPLAIYPPIIAGDFDHVFAAGQRGFKNHALSLDDAINLSGLEGSGRLSSPTTVFRFTGKTHDGSSVDLWAATRGPWMYMRGGTTPPPGSADFFEYHIKALAHSRPFADFTDDGVVDGADLARWSAPSGFLGSDFLAWQQQFGEAPPAEAEFESAITAASQGAASEAPEPGTAALVVAAGVVVTAYKRRRLALM